jgi:Lrp/AsnC family leucine-responsive transcriptional regulator
MAFNPDQPLDPVDARILEELQENARITYSELGRRVALTPPAAAERVRRLEEAGMIAGYRVDLDLARVGLPITAFVRMRAAGDLNCVELGHHTRELPEVLECHRVTGEDSYIAKVAVRSVEHLQELIDGLMPYAETITSVVLSSPVTNRVVRAGPPEEEPAPPRRRGARSA